MGTVGFTGTREGATKAQERAIERILRLMEPKTAHHGDCIGADAQFHEIAARLGCEMHVHPCDITEMRAGKTGVMYPVLPPLTRNKDIVDASEFVISCPYSKPMVRKGGTYRTTQYARAIGKTIFVIYPDGTMEG